MRCAAARLPASFSVEAAVVASVFFLSIGHAVRFAWRQEQTVTQRYEDRLEEMKDAREAGDAGRPEEYLRAVTLWEGIRRIIEEEKEDDGT